MLVACKKKLPVCTQSDMNLHFHGPEQTIVLDYSIYNWILLQAPTRKLLVVNGRHAIVKPVLMTAPASRDHLSSKTISESDLL